MKDDAPPKGRGQGEEPRNRGGREGTGETVDREVLPLAAEEAAVSTRQVETGRVRVATRTKSREERFDVDLAGEEVEVRRVPVGREVDGPVAVRQEGEVTIVPVLEEVLVVSKQLMLKEEVHIRKRVDHRTESRTAELRYEEPLIERSDEAAREGRTGRESEEESH